MRTVQLSNICTTWLMQYYFKSWYKLWKCIMIQVFVPSYGIIFIVIEQCCCSTAIIIILYVISISFPENFPSMICFIQSNQLCFLNSCQYNSFYSDACIRNNRFEIIVFVIFYWRTYIYVIKPLYKSILLTTKKRSLRWQYFCPFE